LKGKKCHEFCFKNDGKDFNLFNPLKDFRPTLCNYSFFLFFTKKGTFFLCCLGKCARIFFSNVSWVFDREQSRSNFKVAFGFVVISMQLQKIGVVFGATICFDGS